MIGAIVPPPSQSLMATTSSLDAEAGIVTLTFTGVTSFAEWERAIDGILADPRYRVGMCLLSDRRRATDIMSKEYIDRVVDYLSLHGASFVGCGWALVASTPADFGMTRMAATFAERTVVNVRAFQRMEDAVEWLRTINASATTPAS